LEKIKVKEKTMDHVTAVFKTRTGAEDALRKIEAIGISDSQVSIVASDETRGKAFGFEKGTKTDKGFAAGATTGGLVGAVLGSLLAAGTIAIPGLNLVVTGYLVPALAGLGAGAATGGLIGALAGMGFEENEAKFYEDELKDGNILLAVKIENENQKNQDKEILDETESYSFDPGVFPAKRSDIRDTNVRL
jgi:uncharacterized membrane protein